MVLYSSKSHRLSEPARRHRKYWSESEETTLTPTPLHSGKPFLVTQVLEQSFTRLIIQNPATPFDFGGLGGEEIYQLIDQKESTVQAMFEHVEGQTLGHSIFLFLWIEVRYCHIPLSKNIEPDRCTS